MKLAIVTAYPPSKVTLTEYGYHLVKHFRLQDEVDEIVLITDRTEGEKDLNFEEEGCKITVKECWSFNSYGNFFRIARTLESVKPDAVLFNLQFLKFGDKKVPAALGLMLPMYCRLRGIPTISLLHNIMEQVDLDNAGITGNKWLQKIYNFIGTTLTKMVLRSDILAVTISKYVDILEKKYKARNVALVPHGTFETPEEPSYVLPEGPMQVMAFGKFGTYKKVEILIEAVELIRKRSNLDMEIVIAGTDSPNTPGYLDGIQQQYAHVKGLQFTGYVAEEDVPGLFRDSAVTVFPYTSTTGSSGVLHQAGCYGKAAVLPDLGDLSILVREEGYAGEFFDPKDVASLADAIEKVLANEAYRIYLGKTNYEAACAIPMSRIASMYLEYFKAIQFTKLTGFDLDLPKSEEVLATKH
ncbi:MAG: glycosyltransferase [Eudoraea sp.]|nr:glycosyltransferase [Eudoraea sp.]NNK31242.1 glycosyltransferase [Flavobacteriaceae bacterium]